MPRANQHKILLALITVIGFHGSSNAPSGITVAAGAESALMAEDPLEESPLLVERK